LGLPVSICVSNSQAPLHISFSPICLLDVPGTSAWFVAPLPLSHTESILRRRNYCAECDQTPGRLALAPESFLCLALVGSDLFLAGRRRFYHCSCVGSFALNRLCDSHGSRGDGRNDSPAPLLASGWSCR